MIYRNGTEADVIKVSRLWCEMVKEMKPEWNPNIEWWRNIARGNLRQGIYNICLMEEGGKIMGFLDWFLFPEPSTGKVHAVGQHLYIVPECRGDGRWRKLYKMAIKNMLDKKADIVELFCFEDEKSFWQRLGFSPIRTLMRRENV